MPNRRLISTRTASAPNGTPEGSGYVWRGQRKAPPTTSSRRDGEKQALGEAIRAARKARDLRQSSVAAAAGISGAHLSNIENGHDRPSPEVLSRLAAVLGVTPQDLAPGLTPVARSVPAARPVPRAGRATRPSPPLPSGSAAERGPLSPGVRAGDNGLARSPGHQMAAAAMSEDELERAMRRILKDLPSVRGFHARDSRRSAGVGYPDWTLAGDGGVIWRELKTAKGRLTWEQDVWLCALTDAGQDADVWRPADLLSGRIALELAALAGVVRPPRGAA